MATGAACKKYEQVFLIHICGSRCVDVVVESSEKLFSLSIIFNI